jgi:hypothetical protein
MRNKYIVPIPSLTCDFKKALLLSLVPFTNVCWETEKKICGVLRTSPAESLPHTPLSSVGLRFCFFGQFSTEGTEVKTADPNRGGALTRYHELCLRG